MLPDSILHPVDIVYGVYRLDGPLRGHDRWWIQRLVESETGWMMHGDLFLDAPTRRYVTLDVEMTEEWGWAYLNLRDDAGRLLSAEVEPGRVHGDLNGERFDFPFDDESELDALSPFMNSLALRRLQLAPGQSAERRVVCFASDDFAPRLVTQRYTRGEDAEIVLGGTTLVAQRVHFHDLDRAVEATLLVRDDGLLLSYPGYGELERDERASAGRGRMPPLDERGR